MSRTALASLLPFVFASSFLHARQDKWGVNDHVYLTADGLYLRRSQKAHGTIVNDSSRVHPKVISKGGLVGKLGWEPAGRGVLTIMPSVKWALEFNYLYVQPWEAHETAKANGTLSFPFSLDKVPEIQTLISKIEAFFSGDKATARYHTWFENGEANYLGYLSPPKINYFTVAWIAGFRGALLQETFTLKFRTKHVDAKYDSNAKNYMYGIQMGLIFQMNPSERWTWSIIVKGAGFADQIHTRVSLSSPSSGTTFVHRRKTGWGGTTLLDGYGSLSFQLFPHLNIHAGYQVYWFNGVALATDQTDRKELLSSRNKIHNGSYIVIDGAFAGITLSY